MAHYHVAIPIAEVFHVSNTLLCFADLVVDQVEDLHDREKVKQAIRSSVMSKQYGNEDFLSDLITKACIAVLPDKTFFNVDNIRVCKILVSECVNISIKTKVDTDNSSSANELVFLQGSGIHASQVMQGMVFKREVEGDTKKAEDCKVVVYTCPLDIMQTETKVNLLFITLGLAFL